VRCWSREIYQVSHGKLELLFLLLLAEPIAIAVTHHGVGHGIRLSARHVLVLDHGRLLGYWQCLCVVQAQGVCSLTCFVFQHRRNFETHALTHLLALRCACLLVRCFASCLAKVADPVAKTYVGATIDTKMRQTCQNNSMTLP
jgi:hypothetical protein